MNHQNQNTRTFRATFASSAEAELFLTHFIDKTGAVDGRDYECIRYGKGNNGKHWTAVVELSPWISQSNSRSIDFGSVLTSASARELLQKPPPTCA